MKLPNGYGSVIKLSSKRRKPYAVRTSDIVEYIDIYAPFNIEDSLRREFKKRKITWKRNILAWSCISSDALKEYVESLPYEFDYVYRQSFKYHAYFEKSDMAYAYLAEFNNGNVVNEQKKFTDNPTFAEMYRKWERYRRTLKTRIADSTWRNYEIAFNHLAPLHHKKFISIRTQEIQDVLNQYNCKSQTTIGSIRAVLKGMYTYAKMNEYTDKDLTEFLVYEWSESEEQIHAPYTDEEIATLWKKLYEINNVDIILIYIYTGLRTIELLNILTENVHLDEQYMIGGQKTENGKDRIIPIADKILPLVKNRYNPDRKYLVNNRYGNHYTTKSYAASNFNNVMNQLKFNHLPYDSRHTFATLMDRAGANIVCTKLIMGHSLKNDVTLGVYTHKTKDDLLNEINKI